MSLLNGDDLLEAGWPAGPGIGLALAKAAEYEARGITDRAYVLKLLRRDMPVTVPKISRARRRRSSARPSRRLVRTIRTISRRCGASCASCCTRRWWNAAR